MHHGAIIFILYSREYGFLGWGGWGGWVEDPINARLYSNDVVGNLPLYTECVYITLDEATIIRIIER